MTPEQLKKLTEPMEYHWKIQAYIKNKDKKVIAATVVAYVDARDVQKRLDEVVGPAGWQDKFQECAQGVIGTIGIKCGDEWLWKSDLGTPGDFEKEKGAFSDAFKRAAIHWGIGRFLYDLPRLKIDINDKEKPVDKNGSVVWDITKWAEDQMKPPGKKTTPQNLPEGPKTAEPVKEAPEKKICPYCKNEHTGDYLKCRDCYFGKNKQTK